MHTDRQTETDRQAGAS